MKVFNFKSPISQTKFIIYFSLVIVFIYNIPLYKFSLNSLELYSYHFYLVIFCISIALFSINVFLFSMLSTIITIKIFKILFIVITLCNSIALYFINTYNVILDKSMMGNVFNTNSVEAFSYYSSQILLYLLIFGIIPSIVIYKLNIYKSKKTKLIFSGISFMVSTIIIFYINSITWLWFDKHAKILGGLTLPWSYIINAVRYKKEELKKTQTIKQLPDITFTNNDEKLVVLIIGESARSANFSLYGYEKNTNPNLKNQNITILNNSKSTTTYTTASIHSMFSYTGSTFDSFETLPNYLQRNGVDVLWRANNWGVQKLKLDNFENLEFLKKSCNTKNCDFDEGLLTNLKNRILSLKANKKFVVLHTEGSHGPTYFKKYPKEFEFFKPVCKSVDLSICTKEELFNAYDNSILFTDYFINKTIDILKQIEIPSIMIYISDHGESLGENGLYLHGTPYSIAPNFQKDIPFIIWSSKNFTKEIKNKKEYGQYNIFHTVMNALDLKSPIYNEEFNILTTTQQ